MLTKSPGVTYDGLRRSFQWDVPDKFNIGLACTNHQRPVQTALVEIASDGKTREFTFGDLTELSNRFANALSSIGVNRGDRVGIVLPQRVETALAHLAVYKLGGIAVPLSRLFGPDALEYRLSDCDARAVLVEPAGLEKTVEATSSLTGVSIISTSNVADPHLGFWDLLERGASTFDPAETAADDPALLIYTSGTTGPPKGALHAHRVLLGHMPGFDLMLDFFGEADDRMWTPADWAWIGGLLDALLPSLLHGRPVVGAERQGFQPDWAVDLMVRHRVRNAFLPPTGLKMLRQADIDTSSLDLRSAMSGGEPLGQEMLAWGSEALGVTINEIYGQTEANLVVGNSQDVWPVRPGSMGRPFPGHHVGVVDDEGSQLPPDEVGQIAVRSPDPVMFKGYWNRPDMTREKFRGDWMLTGDVGHVDPEGYFWFKARADDVIISAGYRIGPGEVEDSLMQHEAVALAAVVGVPDDTRGQSVKAYIQLAEGTVRSQDLAVVIRDHVRERLSAHEYPRQIEFVDQLPLTTTGKIRRAELRAWHQSERTTSRGPDRGHRAVTDAAAGT